MARCAETAGLRVEEDAGDCSPENSDAVMLLHAVWFQGGARTGRIRLFGSGRKGGCAEEIGGKTERPSRGVEKGTKTVE